MTLRVEEYVRQDGSVPFKDWFEWGPGYRVYLAKDGETLVLLFYGGTKKRQQTDIATALTLHDEYKARKKAARRAGPPRARGKR